MSTARDTLQFVEVFRPVVDRLNAFTRSLQFTMSSRRAALASQALQVYFIARGLTRDVGSASLGPSSRP